MASIPVGIEVFVSHGRRKDGSNSKDAVGFDEKKTKNNLHAEEIVHLKIEHPTS